MAKNPEKAQTREKAKRTEKKPGIPRFEKKHILYISAAAFAAAILAFAMLFDWDTINSYYVQNNFDISYARAVVVGIEEQSVGAAEGDEKLYLGQQTLTVRILEGEHKGEEVEVTNYLTKIHSIFVTEGDRIILSVDDPDEADPYYTVYNYDRTLPLLALIGFFVVITLLVGRMKGLRALLGLGYTILFIVMFLVQAIYHGFSPLGVSFVTILITAGVSLLLLNGFTRRTAAGMVSTVAGVAVTAILYLVFAKALHLSGYNMDTAEQILLVGDETGLSIRYMLLAAVLIASLGAVMDVSVSMTASMAELKAVNPDLTARELFKSGMNIGKDIIGTMSNTLILAFAGSELDTLICLLAYGYHGNQLFSSDFFALEMAQGLCATSGVVLTVPITILVSIVFLQVRGPASRPSPGIKFP